MRDALCEWHALAGETVGGRYVLRQMIARGSSGAVFEARADGGVDCAIKLVPRATAGVEGKQRLLREAKLLGQLQSRHVVRVEDVGHDDALGMIYLAMPLLKGGSVADRLAEEKPFEPHIAVRIAIQACKGLALAHAAGVVHRDVKPSNLLLSVDGNGTTVLVCDFGLAKPLELYDDSDLTFTGRFLGSPAYMSPEQAQDAKHVDERTDVWSLGVVLYEMLCGKCPLVDVTTLSDLLVSLCKVDAQPIQETAPWIEPGLAQAVHRALRRDREQRWPSAARFAEALRPFSSGSDRLSIGEPLALREETRARLAARADFSVRGTARTAELDDPMIERTLDGRYHVVRAISRGGMGVVYEAEDQEKQRVAVKIVAREVLGISQEAVQRLVREARTAGTVQHPNVVRVLGTGYDDDILAPFVVMELVDGIDLGTLYKRLGPIEPLPLARLFVQVCAGIAAAHEVGIVHRDIKPSNLLVHVDRTTEVLTIKVADFGIARAAFTGEDSGFDLTGTGRIVGSPFYMSPEQARNAKHVDVRADVWSTCISLYEGLSGVRAWHGKSSLGEIILAICTESLEPLAHVAPWVPLELSRVVQRGLETDPARRWPNMRSLEEALRALGESQTPVKRSELKSVEEARRTVAPRRRTSESARWGARRFVVAGVGLVAIAGTAVAFSRTSNGVEEPSAPSAASAAPNLRMAAKVTVRPPRANVRVNHALVSAPHGELALDGVPGTAYDIELTDGSRSHRQRVVIAADGTASPDRIELKDEVVPTTETATPVVVPAIRKVTRPVTSVELPPAPAAVSSDALKPPASWGAK